MIWALSEDDNHPSHTSTISERPYSCHQAFSLQYVELAAISSVLKFGTRCPWESKTDFKPQISTLTSAPSFPNISFAAHFWSCWSSSFPSRFSVLPFFSSRCSYCYILFPTCIPLYFSKLNLILLFPAHISCFSVGPFVLFLCPQRGLQHFPAQDHVQID